MPETLLAYLRRHNCDASVITPGIPMPTVPLAAAAIGVQPIQILKSLLFTDGNGNAVLAIAAGIGKINRQKLATTVNVARLKLADAPTVQRLTGYPVGGVAPVGHRERLTVIIDRQVMALPVAYGGAGTEHSLLKISPADIQRLTGGIVADIADPAEG